MLNAIATLVKAYIKWTLIIWAVIFAVAASVDANAGEPEVKMSKSKICHAVDSTYYSRTKNYTAFETIDACLEAGGRLPKK